MSEGEPLSPRLGAVILAAGQGTRMRSRLPKVLHPLAGLPLVEHVLQAAHGAGATTTILIVGHGAEAVRAALGGSVSYALQEQQLGTAHAVLQALPLLPADLTHVLVLYGDTPLLTGATLAALVGAASGATLALLTTVVADPTGYGRIVRDGDGAIRAIVEEREANVAERRIAEINVGAYVFEAAWLRAALPTLPAASSGEYYLTDLVARAVAEKRPAATARLADPVEGLGINDRVQLAQAEAVMQGRLRERLLRAGVTMLDPASVWLDGSVAVGPDTVLLPNTHLRGQTSIGAGCRIGPSSAIHDSHIGDDCVVSWSIVEGATLAANVHVGPYSHLRPGARLASGAQVGNYAEIKNSVLGENVQQHHFSYLGDATVGRDTNVGAGTITCNYDGARKHRTTIGERVFLGSDSLLVAPVAIGDDAATASGAVVTRDVAAGKLVAGVPARVMRDWQLPAAEPDHNGEERT